MLEIFGNVIFYPEKIIGRKAKICLSDRGIEITRNNELTLISLDSIQETSIVQHGVLPIKYVYVRHQDNIINYFIISSPAEFIQMIKSKNDRVEISKQEKVNPVLKIIHVMSIVFGFYALPLTLIFFQKNMAPLSSIIGFNLIFHVFFILPVYLEILKVKHRYSGFKKIVLISFVPFIGPFHLFYYWQRYVYPFKKLERK